MIKFLKTKLRNWRVKRLEEARKERDSHLTQIIDCEKEVKRLTEEIENSKYESTSLISHQRGMISNNKSLINSCRILACLEQETIDNLKYKL